MIGSLFYLACVAGIAYYADTKGRSPIVWGLLAVFFSPLIILIILAFMKNLKNEQNLQQVLNQQEQINDRISVNEINNNRRFENIEKDVKKLEDKQNANLDTAAPIALSGAAEAVVPEDKHEVLEAEVVEPSKQHKPEAEEPSELVSQPEKSEVEVPVAPLVAAEASKCPYCDSEVPTGSKFCGNCGAKL